MASPFTSAFLYQRTLSLGFFFGVLGISQGAHGVPVAISSPTVLISNDASSKSYLSQLEVSFKLPAYEKKKSKKFAEELNLYPIEEVVAIEMVPRIDPETGKMFFDVYEESIYGEVRKMIPLAIAIEVVLNSLDRAIDYNSSHLRRIKLAQKIEEYLKQGKSLVDLIKDPNGFIRKQLLSQLGILPDLITGKSLISILQKEIIDYAMKALEDWTINRLEDDLEDALEMHDTFSNCNPKEHESCSFFRFEGESLGKIRFQLLKAYYRQHNYMFLKPEILREN